MPELKTSFRASYGLDAAGEKVTNVALADKSVLTDGVNVAFLIQENTVQVYDPTRTYVYPFVVVFNGRQWNLKQGVTVPNPAGAFNEAFWTPMRTDPKWYPSNPGAQNLKVGDYITIDTAIASNAVELTLPSNAQEGDNISLKDIGGQTGYVSVIVKAGIQSIMDRGERLKQVQMTIPYSEWTFVYANKLWNLFNGSEADLARFVKGGATEQIQSSETIVRQYDQQKPITLVFPKFANNGDIIHFVGMNSSTVPYYHLELKSFDADTSVIEPGTHTKIFQRSLSGFFVFNSIDKTWRLYDSDMTDRLRTVSSDTILFPNETVSVVGLNNTDVSNITLTLPENVEPGDQITVALNYMRLNQTVNIVPSGPDKILTTKELVQFPKRSKYPPSGNWVNTTSLSFNGATDYPPIITFAYIPMGDVLGQWMVVENVPALERVDPLSDATRKRLGVIALANQTQANLNHEDITDVVKELAITPETLANRTANKTRRGIARISTDAENQYPTDDARYLDDVIVTPKMLNNKQATEGMRGLAEIAEQSEANGSTDDSRIITAKKLDARRANPDMAGVAPVVRTGGTPPAKVGENRDNAGTLIYNHADYSNIVTPKTLREFIAVEQALGGVFIATVEETIAGTATTAKYPLAVTPATLHKKTATEERIGLAEIATQAEADAGTDDLRFITPKKLNDRKATEALSGIAKLATQQEFDDGIKLVVAEPDKIKTFFSRGARTSVAEASGLKQSGNLWSTLNFEILVPTESQRGTTSLATQIEVDAGLDDVKTVTAKKLQAKKAKENAEGIIQLASAEEVVLGTVANKAVVPSTLKNAVLIDPRWQATTTVRGTSKISSGAITFIGDDVSGSTQDVELYEKNGYSISPYELNKTLKNFMPRKAKAVDSELLDGIDSTQFVRRDIDQIVNGTLTLTKDLIVNQNTNFIGESTLGKVGDGVKNVEKTRLVVWSPTLNTWTHSVTDNADTATYSIGYQNKKAITFDNNGHTYTGANLTVTGSLTANNGANITGTTATSLAYVLGANVVIGTGAGSVLNLGTNSLNTVIKTRDANTLKVAESGNEYTILSTKNAQTILDPVYVNTSGDTMTGRLNVKAPVTFTIPEANVPIKTVPNSTNFGTWTTTVSVKDNYDLLPGYVVPVPEINSDTGEETGFIDHYEEVHGPGTFSQFGSSDVNGTGTYQMWAPRPTVTTDNHQAQTFWMRAWNPVKNQFDGWGRVYTSNNPPTAGEIGAMSDNGSVFTSLKIRDFIQIGNLRIYADPVKKTVRFDWID